MLRTPVITVAFLLVIMSSGMLLTMGANLWLKSRQNLKAYEENFLTIGTVEQKPDSMRMEKVWNAERKDYEIEQSPQYSVIYPVSILQFEGANYINQPEKRSYYASYAPEYRLISDDNLDIWVLIVEFSPVEDCIPDESIKIHVNQVLNGDENLEGAELWFCDHTNENPSMLFHDKNYVAHIALCGYAHGSHMEEGLWDAEYAPIPLVTSQYDENGNLLEDSIEEPQAYYEVVSDFYLTREGKRYFNYARALSLPDRTFPVTGTGATMLLMPFYQGDAYICEGRDISEEEYETGETVCLVSREFAKNNKLSTGDAVHTSLYYTNSRNTASRNFSLNGNQGFDFNILDANGEIPEVFEENTYKIVGIYDVAAGADPGNYQMAGDEMVVPMNSIRNRDSKNILAYGPMTGSTTSFQIPNGSIEAYMEEWEKKGIVDLEITFYDKGYRELKSDMDNMKSMSLLLGGVGISMSISLLAFYTHLFLSRQKQRIAIERCMGVSKKNCKKSLMAGMLIILMLGSFLGCGAGAILAGSISQKDFHQADYDRTYSNIRASDEKMELEERDDTVINFAVFGVCSVFFVFTGTGMMLYHTKKIFCLEPMVFLTDSKKTDFML